MILLEDPPKETDLPVKREVFNCKATSFGNFPFQRAVCTAAAGNKTIGLLEVAQNFMVYTQTFSLGVVWKQI